jgi:hypothetical protein
MAKAQSSNRDFYKCPYPTCGKLTDSAIGICRHMTSSQSYVAEHGRWMETHGIRLIDIVGTYKPLMDVVKKKVKRNKHEIEEHILTVKGHKSEMKKVVVVKRSK